jgi:hypothetical protein
MRIYWLKNLCGHKTESEATLKTVCPLAVNKKK